MIKLLLTRNDCTVLLNMEENNGCDAALLNSDNKSWMQKKLSHL
jgi:hypothetical protein